MHHSLTSICQELPSDPIWQSVVEFNAALLKQCLKLYKTTSIVMHDSRVDRVAEMIKQADLRDIDEVMPREFEDMTDSSLEEMVEKMAIITHLFSREFELYKNYNQGANVLKSMWS